MRKIQISLGQRFVRAGVRNLRFEIIERALVAKTELVNEHRRVFVGVGIVDRIIRTTTAQALRWARMIDLRYSSAERPLPRASIALFFIAGFNRMPSTALIFAKLSWPITKPVLLLLFDRFCFGIAGV